jgi:hypothetical protein
MFLVEPHSNRLPSRIILGQRKRLELGFLSALICFTITATSVWLGTESNALVVRKPNPREGHFILALTIRR